MLRLEKLSGVWYWSCRIGPKIFCGKENDLVEVFERLDALGFLRA
jgi:hypothetical protein